ncbi:hypothetical protein SISNIDRAFT_482948 [Sistotremastrum niveocremeum HHB9708]|uniref:Uncharacterized protein n=1 Tax=Sistotremastrum niveocremeum HHB9708 TaxID=1314777 RepID=A0A164XWY4_9AGAM|nr:hypothetical protein SISNIDRAFT_482948 [Sistotremastrum niveocremeum HHB9708]
MVFGAYPINEGNWKQSHTLPIIGCPEVIASGFNWSSECVSWNYGQSGAMTLWFSRDSEVNLSSSTVVQTVQCPPHLDTATPTMDQNYLQPTQRTPTNPALMQRHRRYHNGQASPSAADSTANYSFNNGPAPVANYNTQYAQTLPTSTSAADISSSTAQLSLNMPPGNTVGWDQSSNPSMFAPTQSQPVDVPISPEAYSTHTGAFLGELSSQTAQSHTIAQFSELPAHTVHQYATNGHPGAGTPPSPPPASSVKQDLHGQETASYTTSIHPDLDHRRPKRSRTLESEADLPDAEAQPKSPTGSRDPRQVLAEGASRKKKKDALEGLGVVLKECMGDRLRVPETAADRVILATYTLRQYARRLEEANAENRRLEEKIRQLELRLGAETEARDLKNYLVAFQNLQSVPYTSN